MSGGEERAHLSLVETAGPRTTWQRDRCTYAKPHRKGERPVGRPCTATEQEGGSEQESGQRDRESEERARGKKINQGQFEKLSAGHSEQVS